MKNIQDMLVIGVLGVQRIRSKSEDDAIGAYEILQKNLMGRLKV